MYVGATKFIFARDHPQKQVRARYRNGFVLVYLETSQKKNKYAEEGEKHAVGRRENKNNEGKGDRRHGRREREEELDFFVARMFQSRPAGRDREVDEISEPPAVMLTRNGGPYLGPTGINTDDSGLSVADSCCLEFTIPVFFFSL